MGYKYITGNNLYEKQTYRYSEYRGKDFIKEYIESRKKYLKNTENIGGGVWNKSHVAVCMMSWQSFVKI